MMYGDQQTMKTEKEHLGNVLITRGINLISGQLTDDDNNGHFHGFNFCSRNYSARAGTPASSICGFEKKNVSN